LAAVAAQKGTEEAKAYVQQLDGLTLSNYNVVWNVSGHVTINVTWMGALKSSLL
jgi:hypothetical protein